MSAIGIDHRNTFNDKALLIGAHADFRYEDYHFARMQSPSFREAKWQSRIRPMLSWGEILTYAGGAMLAIIAIAIAG